MNVLRKIKFEYLIHTSICYGGTVGAYIGFHHDKDYKFIPSLAGSICGMMLGAYPPTVVPMTLYAILKE